MTEDWSTLVTAAEARAMWTTAKSWLVVWASAGFVPTIKGDRLCFPAEWQKKFPDGPHLVEALRAEIAALVRDGNKAVLADPQLNVAYPQYLADRHDGLARQLRHAEACARRAREELDKIETEQATHPRPT